MLLSSIRLAIGDMFRVNLCKPHACALSRLCQQLLEEVSSVPSLLSNRAAGSGQFSASGIRTKE